MCTTKKARNGDRIQQRNNITTHLAIKMTTENLYWKNVIFSDGNDDENTYPLPVFNFGDGISVAIY